MSAGEMSGAEATALVQRIMDADYASDDEVVTGWASWTELWRARPDMSGT